jgi:hypothetical protein
VVAIAVNGRIRGVGETFRVANAQGERYSVLLPEAVVGAGRQRVEVFEVDLSGGATTLRRLARTF